MRIWSHGANGPPPRAPEHQADSLSTSDETSIKELIGVEGTGVPEHCSLARVEAHPL